MWTLIPSEHFYRSMDRTRCLRPGQCLLTRSGGCCCGEERFNTVSATILNANQKKNTLQSPKKS